MLCSEELDGLTSALEMVKYVPGKDFDIIVISIDPSEGTGSGCGQKRDTSSVTVIPRAPTDGIS